MTEHHPLAPLRPWLIGPGPQQKIISALLIAALVGAVILMALNNPVTTGNDHTNMDDIEIFGAAP